MLEIEDALAPLPGRHQRALRWYLERSGSVQALPVRLPDGTLRYTRAKGIYKPKWTDYALSVRQTIKGTYADRDPELRPNGTWSYDYFQENEDPSQRDAMWTNSGLVRCMDDAVPIGVLRQVSQEPSRYRGLGLGIVTAWHEGLFHLEGFSTYGLAYERQTEAEIGQLVSQHEGTTAEIGSEHDSVEEARERAIGLVVRRRGQPVFRRLLIEAYQGKCAISGCDGEVGLEACHIRPYNGPATNSLGNGLLLRADLHNLFDLGLLAVDIATMTVVVARELQQTSYGELAGKTITLPTTAPKDSCIEALDWHRRWSEL